jgi:hypothetical protein
MAKNGTIIRRNQQFVQEIIFHLPLHDHALIFLAYCDEYLAGHLA